MTVTFPCKIRVLHKIRALHLSYKSQLAESVRQSCQQSASHQTLCQFLRGAASCPDTHRVVMYMDWQQCTFQKKIQLAAKRLSVTFYEPEFPDKALVHGSRLFPCVRRTR